MKKKPLTLLEQIFEQNCPEFENYRAVLGKGDRINQGRTDVSSYVARLAKEMAKASHAYYADNSISNFQSYVTAKTAHDNAEAAYNALANMTLSGRHSDEDIDVLLAALKVVRDRLAKRIAKLNDDEAARLAEAGVDTGGAENPAISALKQKLSQIAEAIIAIQDYQRDSHGRTFQWNHCAQLIKLP